MKNAGTKKRRRLAAMAVMVCALSAVFAFPATQAAAESGDSAEIRPISDGGFDFPDITGPTAPEEYPFLLGKQSPEIIVRQIDDQKIVGEYVEGGYTAWTIEAEPAHDADGATVPTTVKLTEGDIVTLIIHFRAGNPAAGGAPFVYPIVGGEGWEGGWRSGTVEINEPKPPVSPSTSPILQTCKVPSLRGLSLHIAKERLRTAHCVIGQIHLASGATDAKAKIVKQFQAAGTTLAADAPVAVKLGPS